MDQSLIIKPNSTVQIYSVNTPIIPERPPTISVKNNGPANLTIKNYWAPPIGGWNELFSIQILAGETKNISGERAYYYYKVDVINENTDTEATIEVKII